MDFIYEVGFYKSGRHVKPHRVVYYKRDKSVQKLLSVKNQSQDIRVRYICVPVGSTRHFEALISEKMRIRKMDYAQAYNEVYHDYMSNKEKIEVEEGKKEERKEMETLEMEDFVKVYHQYMMDLEQKKREKVEKKENEQKEKMIKMNNKEEEKIRKKKQELENRKKDLENNVINFD